MVRYSHVAIICDSLCNGFFRKSTGHNPFESLAFGIPTIIGKNYGHWKSTIDSLCKDDVIFKSCLFDIPEIIEKLLSNKSFYDDVVNKISKSKYLQYQKSSSARIATQIASSYGKMFRD